MAVGPKSPPRADRGCYVTRREWLRPSLFPGLDQTKTSKVRICLSYITAETVFLLRRLVLLALLLTQALPIARAQEYATVTIYAAISLKDALDQLAKRFETDTGSKVTVAYAGSPMLARQIEKGAPADVFISADRDWMDYLESQKAIRAGSRVNLVSNRLVLIAPADSGIALTIGPNFPLPKALGRGRLAMADPDSVPAGKYGKAALEKLGIWPEVAPKVARAENVRAALALVARAEASLGIVYRTDALAERKVRVVDEFSPALHPPIVYPAAVLTESRSKTAETLLRFLQSAPARAVWLRHGFAPGK
jgi:molybdate transport system substrate-binding protein